MSYHIVIYAVSRPVRPLHLMNAETLDGAKAAVDALIARNPTEPFGAWAETAGGEWYRESTRSGYTIRVDEVE